MNHDQITAFISLAENGTMTGAAESLFVTQSTLSNRIASLEEELGRKLAVRGKGSRHVALTEEGQVFLTFAYKWKQLYEETLNSVSSAPGSILSIGSAGSLSKYLIQNVLEQYSDKKDSANVRFMLINSPESYEYVRNKDVEAAFIANPRFVRQIVNVPLFKEKMFFVCHSESDYPDSVHPSDLDPRKGIALNWHREYTQWHDYWFGGISGIRTNDMNTLDTFLRHKSAWAVVPFSVASGLSKRGSVKICDIRKGPEDRTTYMIRNRHEDMSGELVFFLELLNKRVSSLGIKWI